MKKFLLLLLIFPSLTFAQLSGDEGIDLDGDDLNIGGDIFSDFNEDIESHQMAEDERYYRYGRFFGFQLGIGLTTFDGNRGDAYENDHPTFNMALSYFLDFQTSFNLGVAFSKHHMFMDSPTFGIEGQVDANGDPVGYGLIRVNMLRVYLGYRYYIDTHDLGTAITYSNPYLTVRLEYWYVTNKYDEQPSFEDDTGGGLGVGLGGGFDFPIRLKESYLNVEFLWHTVDFHDKFTQDYRAVDGSTFGFDDLTGNAYTMVTSYVWNW